MVTYEVAAQTERTARRRRKPRLPRRKRQTNAEEAGEEADGAAVSYPIDLNTATIEELMTLPRIGEKLAQRIRLPRGIWIGSPRRSS
ncbi:MAG: ComEA family DNA-binding protein [Oscillospiraceae bacterium]